MIELIAIDLDGTLLKTDKTISKENLQAIHYAQNKGIKVVICTGRPYLAMRQFAEEIGFNDEGEYIVVFNGSQVRRAKDGQVLVNQTLTYDDLTNWMNITRELDLPLNVFDSDWVYDPTWYPAGYPSTYLTPAPRKTVDFKQFESNHAFNKFVVCTTEQHLNEQLPKMDANLYNQYHIVLSHPYQIEVGQAGVSKGTALERLGETINIPLENMMAFGDEHNDQTMIDMVGYGIAMGNAVEAIKASATYITETNDNNGVAQGIYHFIK